MRDALFRQRGVRTGVRLVSADGHAVVFRTRGTDTATSSPSEFIGRFLLHILPSHFVKIRHFGLMASGSVATKLERARALLSATPVADACSEQPDDDQIPETPHVDPALPWPALLLGLTGIDALLCPRCQQPTLVRVSLPQARASPPGREST